MKLLLFSDLHLDAPFAWMGATGSAASNRRQALCETLMAILDLARSEKVDAVLCGGDLYEHERFSADTSGFLRSAFESIAPTPVFISPGNHDWYGPESIYCTNRWSDNVHIFSEPVLKPVQLDDDVTLWGAAHTAPSGARNFLAGFTADAQGVNVALFHGSEMGALPYQESDKALHAPFNAAEIDGAGLSHAFLGHFHTPRDHELYTYPGNPDPLTFGETGERGAVIINLSSGSSPPARRRFSVARTQAHDLRLDITGCTSLHSIREHLEAILRGLTGVARVTVAGELAPEVTFEPARIGEIENRLDGLMIMTEELTVGYDLDRIKEEPTVRGEFVRMVLESDLETDQVELVLRTGLRALDGRDDLEVV